MSVSTGPDNLSTYSISPKRYVSKDASKQPRYVEVATSSQPYPVARLLDQITALNEELSQERKWRTEERRELTERHRADLKRLENLKDDADKKLLQFQGRYEAEHKRFVAEARKAEEDWKSLAARVSVLRSELDSMSSMDAVDPTNTMDPMSSMDPKNATDSTKSQNHQMQTKARASNLTTATDASTQTSEERGQVDVLQYSKRDDASLKGSHSHTVTETPKAWQQEKIQLLNRVKALESTIAALQGEARSSNEFTTELQKRHREQQAIHQKYDFDLADLQQRTKVQTELLKEVSEGYKDLEFHLQQQSKLVQRANDVVRLNTQPSNGLEPPPSNEGPTLAIQGPKDGQGFLRVESRPFAWQLPGPMADAWNTIRSPDCQIDTTMLSVDSAVTEKAGSHKGRKRDFSSLLDGQCDESPIDSHRRRTGLQTYTSQPVQLSIKKEGETSDVAAKTSDPLPSSLKWRLQKTAFQSTSFFKWAKTLDDNLDKLEVPPQSPSQPQPAAVAPPDPPKGVGLERPDDFGIKRKLRFKAPNPTYTKRWQNSVLKKFS